jgi:pimeloyl-ACP methyl ester carboxylesterase
MAHPVVLIHGMWCTGGNLERVAAALRARGFECHVPDLPAHEAGVRHAEVGSMSLRDYLAHLERYIAGKNFGRPPILLGHSMGGLLAQQLASRIDTFALVLLTPASPAGINAIRPGPLAAFAKVLSTPGFWHKPNKPSFERGRISAFNGLPEYKQNELYAGMVEESGRALLEIALWLLDRSRASRVDVASVNCPVYVVAAGKDHLTPAPVVRKVAALYDRATLRYYPQRSHWVIDDDETDEMAGEIAGWLLPYEQRAARGLPMRG